MKEEAEITWWKMKEKEGCIEFREELRQALSGRTRWEELPDEWESAPEVVRETAKKVSGISSGQRILGGEMRKCRKVLRGRGWQRLSRDLKEADRSIEPGVQQERGGKGKGKGL